MSVFMVEIVGVEPTTLCLQSRCSSQLSYTPVFSFLLSDNCVRLLILPPHNHKVAASVGARLPCSHKLQNFEHLRRWTAHRRSVIYRSKLPSFSLVRLESASKFQYPLLSVYASKNPHLFRDCKGRKILSMCKFFSYFCEVFQQIR